MNGGLYNERTTLAWSRSALSLVAVGALAAKQTGTVAAGLPLLLSVVLVASLMFTHADRRHARRHDATESIAVPADLAATATAVVLLALASLAIVIA